MRVASIERTPLALVSSAANCPLTLYVSRSRASVLLNSKSRLTCVILTCNPPYHVTPHVTDFPFGNDPSLKPTFVISSKIPEPEIPDLIQHGGLTVTTSKNDTPPMYNEDHIAGLIHAITTEQWEVLLGKVASNGKGKSKGVMDDREPSFDSDNKDFWLPLSFWPWLGGYMYELPV